VTGMGMERFSILEWRFSISAALSDSGGDGRLRAG